ncbi:MAG: glycosyltransferase family 39 protein [Roseiarcus sp.]
MRGQFRSWTGFPRFVCVGAIWGRRGVNCPRNDGAWLCLALGLAALANASGMFVTILEPDSALYATIAKTMVERHDFVNLFAAGQDWLDKPHLPFWLSAISFSIFGFSAWAYRLPALILVFVAAFYTYLFARQFYERRIALAAAIIFLSAQHIITSSSDVRAEAYLTAFVIGSVYHFYQENRYGSHANLVAGSLLAAAAVMTKGIFTLVPIGGAMGGGLLLSRQWAQAFHVRWLAATLLIFLFISPEIYCLWRQFDSHPEKSVFGAVGVSGLRFFFWDSQFGRFFGVGPIRGEGDPLQYLHVVLWAFLPWSIALYAAVYDAIRKFFSRRPRASEYFNLSGGLLTFLLFSASQFQLPHYLNIAFPFFAILTSSFLFGLTPASERLAHIWQWLIVGVAFAICVTLHLALQPNDRAAPAALLATATLLLATLQIRTWRQWQSQLITILATAYCFANLFLYGYIYPALLKYQAGSEMAAYLNEHYPGRPVLQPRNSYSWALEFYLQAPVTAIDDSTLWEGRTSEGALVYAPAGVLGPLNDKFRLLHRAANYPVSRLTLTFLNPPTRERAVTEAWVVQAQ